VFDPGPREALLDELVHRAHADARVVSAALVGSLTTDTYDRWSDIDLSLGVAGDDVGDVLEEWTTHLVEAHGASVLLDLPVRTTTYRVYLLAGGLQVDLSVTPATDFFRGSPRFRLLFGQAREHPPSRDPDPTVIGWVALYARSAHVAIRRGRLWQAQQYVGEIRDRALELACGRHGLVGRFAKEVDRLPAELLDEANGCLVREISEAELTRALAASVALCRAQVDGELDRPVAELLDAVAAG
jgi:hypothetical protein